MGIPEENEYYSDKLPVCQSLYSESRLIEHLINKNINKQKAKKSNWIATY